MKILIVDDEKLARDRLKRLIESMPNFQVVASASNVTEALAMATSTEPDIVLMDIRMPGIDGIQAANHSHVFLGATKEADIAMLKTAGNNDSHIILRGGKEPNFDVESIETTLAALREAEINESIMIDASHGNSQKKFKQQISVVDSISDQICSGNKNINGVMIESHLVEGNQSITDNLTYGQSITDACIGWEDTVKCLETLSAAVQTRRGR